MNSENTSLVKSENSSGLVSKGYLNEVTASRGLLVQYVKDHMKDGVDAGRIPGCPKPSLFKPGAEKLAQLFHLRARIVKVDKNVDLKANFAQYDYTMEVYSLKTGEVWGQCEGTCNNMERKYRKADAADVLNTLMKMAQKRAYVGAVIQATSASEFFTQDIEDTGILDGEFIEQASSNGTGHASAHAGDPGDYVCTIGTKFKGKKVRDCDQKELASFCHWLNAEAAKKKESLRNGALELVNNWQRYVARGQGAQSAEDAAADAVDRL